MSAPANKTDFVGNARRNWGDALPDWVVALAEEASRTSGVAAARAGFTRCKASTSSAAASSAAASSMCSSAPRTSGSIATPSAA